MHFLVSYHLVILRCHVFATSSSFSFEWICSCHPFSSDYAGVVHGKQRLCLPAPIRGVRLQLQLQLPLQRAPRRVSLWTQRAGRAYNSGGVRSLGRHLLPDATGPDEAKWKRIRSRGAHMLCMPAITAYTTCVAGCAGHEMHSDSLGHSTVNCGEIYLVRESDSPGPLNAGSDKHKRTGYVSLNGCLILLVILMSQHFRHSTRHRLSYSRECYCRYIQHLCSCVFPCDIGWPISISFSSCSINERGA